NVEVDRETLSVVFPPAARTIRTASCRVMLASFPVKATRAFFRDSVNSRLLELVSFNISVSPEDSLNANRHEFTLIDQPVRVHSRFLEPAPLSIPFPPEDSLTANERA